MTDGDMAGLTGLDARRRQLHWRCRRGLLELDTWLASYARVHLAQLDESECALLESLLSEADADLLAWLQGRQTAPVAYRAMIDRMRAAG